ncbi:hypothetical protein Ddc_22749 [Ditylenchus destructor]|nr:hypothetical protein Ddc_22749 [Ditylenchus destructor]
MLDGKKLRYWRNKMVAKQPPLLSRTLVLRLIQIPLQTQQVQSQPSLRLHHQNPYCKAMRKDLELQHLGEDLDTTIDALASDADQIQKAQVNGLAEATKHHPADIWNLEPRDGGDVNRSIITVDSGDHIRMRTTNEEQLFYQPDFQVMNYRMEEGEELTRANEPYAHCGWPRSGTAMHEEDANFGSMNVGFAGTKAFLLVDTRDTKMFEDWVRGTIPEAAPKGKFCDQWVRHLSIFFRPGQLEVAGVWFTIYIQRVGVLTFKKRNQHYQIITIQYSLSLH